jgi:hypothetical protein
MFDAFMALHNFSFVLMSVFILFWHRTCVVFKFEFEFSKEFVKRKNLFLSFLRPWAKTLFVLRVAH